MAKRLQKRSVVSTKTITSGKPEPEMYTEQGPTNVAVKGESFIGKCTKCNFYQANSRADHLCLDCHKKANGFVFNEEKNRYIKEKK
jgi:hypothetical protein